jgi:hypothetical protein
MVTSPMPLTSIAGPMMAVLQFVSAHGCAPTRYSASEISAAVAASSQANALLKGSSYLWGATAAAESQGNLCASNGYNFGVLQLSRGNLPRRTTPWAYMAQSLQRQVDIWVAQVGNDSSSWPAFQLLAEAQAAGRPIGAVLVTAGTMAACVQFGPTICDNDVTALRKGEPCGGARPVNINSVLRNPSTATMDGNGQTICSWGGGIQAAIDADLLARAGSAFLAEAVALASDGPARTLVYSGAIPTAVREPNAPTAGGASAQGVQSASIAAGYCAVGSGRLDLAYCVKG